VIWPVVEKIVIDEYGDALGANAGWTVVSSSSPSLQYPFLIHF